ncbi:MAG: Crp/Fnr family transcriptional regulator [Bacteriovoracaceae bacterium]
MAGTPTSAATIKKKSGIRTFRQGMVIFKENDPARSLYIIQRGQIRLFRPKGRGFVDLAILRTGEVIGEMAYFDEKSTRRSCSAEAMVTTEVIEISFKAFEKTMAGLNPWFKTIINTLAERLRKTNEKVKNLESNSVGVAKDGKVGDYVFFHTIDVIRILSLLYLNFASTGTPVDGKTQINRSKLLFYMSDLFNIKEVKIEEFLKLADEEGFINIVDDENGKPNLIQTADFDQFRSIMAFMNAQRQLEDSRKLKISAPCERLLRMIVAQAEEVAHSDATYLADLSKIFDNCKANQISISDDDLAEAVEAGLCGDIIVGTGNKLSSEVQFAKLIKLLPSIKMTNAIAKMNESKAGRDY